MTLPATRRFAHGFTPAASPIARPAPTAACLGLRVRSALAWLTATLLVACGGGGGGSPATEPPPAALYTGVFRDSAVAGMAYLTSSGVVGTTNAAGEFQYKAGDTVRFSLGGVPLGESAAASVVTPAHLAGGTDTARFTNLLILLQSLDIDGNAANGITLPAATAVDPVRLAAVVALLGTDPALFGTLAGNANLAALAPGGLIVDAARALAHYELAQSAAFFAQAAGVWTEDGKFDQVVLRLGSNGRYALVQTQPADTAGRPGVEYGMLYRDPVTQVTNAYGIGPDTDGQWGMSHPTPGATMKMDLATGDKLMVEERLASGVVSTTRFSRVPQVSNRIHGAWSLSPQRAFSEPMFVFWADGRYVEGNPAVPSTQTGCGGPGYERGLVAWDGIIEAQPSGVLSYGFVLSSITAESNGCAGLQSLLTPPVAGQPALLNVQAGGDTMILRAPGRDPVTFYRITP